MENDTCSSLIFLDENEEPIVPVEVEPGPELVSTSLSGEGSGLESNGW